uniref:Uncharacterized protein n=1 Tax=Magallana gigas TaxID=29159 RepID=K1QLD6_MAGGI
MSKFIIVDWEDGTSEYYKEDDVVVKEGNAVLKQFGKKMFEGKISSFHNTKTSAKQELAERTEAPKDVAVVSEKDGKRERKMTSKMEESTKLEQQVTQMQSNIQGTVAGISGLQAQLEHDLPGRGWKSDAKWLLRRMFSLAELKGHSITGHHGSKKTGAARPPLENRDKLRVLYDIIMEKYPGRMITDINLVLADVVKPSAAGMS